MSPGHTKCGAVYVASQGMYFSSELALQYPAVSCVILDAFIQQVFSVLSICSPCMVLGPASSVPPGNLLEIQICFHPRASESRILRVYISMNSPGDFVVQ